MGVEELRAKYDLRDTSGWTVEGAKNDILSNEGNYHEICYRPFDIRHIYMTDKSGGFVGRPRLSTMKHFISGENLGLITVRQQSTFDFQHIFITDSIIESGAISLQTKEWGYLYPLYLYIDDSDNSRIPNLAEEFVEPIAETLGLKFTPEKVREKGAFSPLDLIDYIYAVLHSPTYREMYKEFLKIDFPHIPYPRNQKTFWALGKLGCELRQTHLLESPAIENNVAAYPEDGDNFIVRKIVKKDWELYDTENELGRVWINDDQYFDKIPLIAWEFYIGGYQPAQKWLKDRSGRKLTFDDILHYQKIIVALNETHRIMQEIDEIDFE